MSEKDDLLTLLRAALPELRAQWPIQTLSVFGSVARGEATATSDLDLLIEFHQPVSLSRFLALETKRSALTGRPVDLISRPALKPFIGARVIEEAVPV
jgi:hypothetical protein